MRGFLNSFFTSIIDEIITLFFSYNLIKKTALAIFLRRVKNALTRTSFVFEKNYLFSFIPNCTRNHLITYTSSIQYLKSTSRFKMKNVDCQERFPENCSSHVTSERRLHNNRNALPVELFMFHFALSLQSAVLTLKGR